MPVDRELGSFTRTLVDPNVPQRVTRVVYACSKRCAVVVNKNFLSHIFFPVPLLHHN